MEEKMEYSPMVIYAMLLIPALFFLVIVFAIFRLICPPKRVGGGYYRWSNEGDSLDRLERATEVIEQRRNGRWLGGKVQVDVSESELESSSEYGYVERNGKDCEVYLRQK
jgi:hypothetical protein